MDAFRTFELSMRSVFSIFFVILFGVAANIQSSYYYYWKLNQKEITAAFCENLDKPELKCNGKCHLMKKMAVQEPVSQTKKDPASGNTQLRIPAMEWIAHEWPVASLDSRLIPADDQKDQFIPNDNRLLTGFKDDCTHPPDLFA